MVSTVIEAPRAGADRRLLVLLGCLTGLTPLAVDMYLPALPSLTRDLGTTNGAAQLTLAALLLGLATGQLLAGPLSDRLGRRPPVLVGLMRLRPGLGRLRPRAGHRRAHRAALRAGVPRRCRSRRRPRGRARPLLRHRCRQGVRLADARHGGRPGARSGPRGAGAPVHQLARDLRRARRRGRAPAGRVLAGAARDARRRRSALRWARCDRARLRRAGPGRPVPAARARRRGGLRGDVLLHLGVAVRARGDPRPDPAAVLAGVRRQRGAAHRPEPGERSGRAPDRTGGPAAHRCLAQHRRRDPAAAHRRARPGLPAGPPRSAGGRRSGRPDRAQRDGACPDAPRPHRRVGLGAAGPAAVRARRSGGLGLRAGRRAHRPVDGLDHAGGVRRGPGLRPGRPHPPG